MTDMIDWEEIPEHVFDSFMERLVLVESLTDDSIDKQARDVARRAYIDKHMISDQTIRRYIRKYKNRGPAGLLFVRAHKRAMRIGNVALREKITTLVRELPTRSVPQLRRLISQDEALHREIELVSDRTIYRYLKENGMSHRERYALLREAERKAFHSFEAPHSLALVQGDARDGIWLNQPDGSRVKTFLFLWIDDFSRKILFGKYYTSEKLPFMEDSLRVMILRYGIPMRIYLDNGKVYVSRHFAFILSSLAIKKLHHPPYQAHCKGKVERDMQTIKRQFQDEAALAGFHTVEELNTAFWAWCDLCYNKKVHATTGESPDVRFVKGLQKDHKRITDLTWFNNLFLWRDTRTVTKYGKIKLYSNEYPVTKVPPGVVARLLFDPFDLATVYVVDEKDSVLEKTTPGKKVNAKVPDIPGEKKTKIISRESHEYFAKLREQHMEMQKDNTRIDFSAFNKNQNKEDKNE
jgi:putative transposase